MANDEKKQQGIAGGPTQGGPTQETPSRLAAINSQHAAVRQNYDRANAEYQRLEGAQRRLSAVPNPGRDTAMNPIFAGRAPAWAVAQQMQRGDPALAQAQAQVQAQAAQALKQREDTAPEFRRLSGEYRDFTRETNANRLLQSVGVQPTARPAAPAAATQQPAAAPAAAPAADGTPPTNGGQARADTEALPNAPDGTYRTGDGRLGVLPQGVSVATRPDGTPVFSDSPAGAQALAGGAGPVAQGQPASASNAVAARLLPQIEAASTGGPRRLSGPVGAVISNPDPRQESLRRSQLEWDLRTLGRGSPSMRRALMDQYGQEQRIGADSVNQQQRLSADVAMNNQRLDAAAIEGAANRRLTGTGQMLDVARIGEQARQFDQTGQVVTGADGNAGLLRQDGTVRRVLDEEGNQFRPAATEDRGQVTPAMQFQELSKQLQSLRETSALTPNPQATQQIQQIEAQMAALAGGNQVQQGVPSEPPAAAISELRANPGTRAQFDEAFGRGAAARYLGN